MSLSRTAILVASGLLGLVIARAVPAGWLFVPTATLERGADEVGGARYACPMFCTLLDSLPADRRCPVCGMELGMVSDELSLDRHEQWITGLEAVRLGEHALSVELRLVGEVAYDESRLTTVSARAGGWIETLHKKVTWESVEADEPLFEMYSPELFQAQQELVAARGSDLVGAARERLALLGVDEREIDLVLASGEPLREVPFRAPSSGVVLRRTGNEGAHVQSGTTLFELVDLEHVWLQFEVFDTETRWLSLGSRVLVRDEWGAEERVGEVVFIDPVIDRMARTQRVRVEIENRRRPDGTYELAPGRRVSATLQVPMGTDGRPLARDAEQPAPILALPRDAVLSSGERDIVYVLYEDHEDGKRDYALDPERLPSRIGYELVQVQVGDLARRADSEAPDWFYPVLRVVPSTLRADGLEALEAGHLVVVKGSLLLDSQAQLAGRPSLQYPSGRQGGSGAEADAEGAHH